MDKEVKSRRSEFAEELEAASLKFLEVAVGMRDEGVDGSCWPELFAAMCECMAWLTKLGKAPKFTAVHAKGMADGYTTIARAYVNRRLHLLSMYTTAEAKKIDLFGQAIDKLWETMPGWRTLLPNFPPDLWGDHPDNKKKAADADAG